MGSLEYSNTVVCRHAGRSSQGFRVLAVPQGRKGMKEGKEGRKESVLGSYQKWDMITGGSQKMSERVSD